MTRKAKHKAEGTGDPGQGSEPENAYTLILFDNSTCSRPIVIEYVIDLLKHTEDDLVPVRCKIRHLKPSTVDALRHSAGAKPSAPTVKDVNRHRPLLPGTVGERVTGRMERHLPVLDHGLSLDRSLALLGLAGTHLTRGYAVEDVFDGVEAASVDEICKTAE